MIRRHAWGVPNPNSPGKSRHENPGTPEPRNPGTPEPRDQDNNDK